MNFYVAITIASITVIASSLGVVFLTVMYQNRRQRHADELRRLEEIKQQELTMASIRSEEAERERIAGELHDDVGATLASARLYISLMAKKLGQSEVSDTSLSLIDESVEKVRVEPGDPYTLVLEHNGDGLVQDDYTHLVGSKNGIGLKNIDNRLQIIKSSIFFERVESDRFRITLRIPIS